MFFTFPSPSPDSVQEDTDLVSEPLLSATSMLQTTQTSSSIVQASSSIVQAPSATIQPSSSIDSVPTLPTLVRTVPTNIAIVQPPIKSEEYAEEWEEENKSNKVSGNCHAVTFLPQLSYKTISAV